MTEKILDYRKVNSPKQAREVIKYFENRYLCHYSWAESNGEIDNAVAVCVLVIDDCYKFVTTAADMNYIERREVVKTYTLGEV